MGKGLLIIPFLFIFASLAESATIQEQDKSKSKKDLAGIEDLLGEFDKPQEIPMKSPDIRRSPEWLDLGGSFRFFGSFGYAHDKMSGIEGNHGGLNLLKSRLQVAAKIDLPNGWRAKISGYGIHNPIYHIKGRHNFTDSFLNNSENEIELEDAWIEGRVLRKLDLKIGRQIIVWGKSDNLRVTDVLNPLDQRELGLTDIEDLRLPVAMTRLDTYFGKWNLTGIIIHESRQNKVPAYGSDYYPFLEPLQAQEKPTTALKNQELAIALSGAFSGWDLSFHGAYIFSDNPHLQMGSSGTIRHRNRVFMLGSAGNIAIGNWLFKGEVAVFDGIEFPSESEMSFFRMDTMVGVEYYGFSETTLCFELVNRHLFNLDNTFKQGLNGTSSDQLEWAFRLTRDFWHDRLQLTALAIVSELNGEGGAFERIQVDYDVRDWFTVTAGVVNYQSGYRTPFQRIGDNDRIFGGFEISF